MANHGRKNLEQDGNAVTGILVGVVGLLFAAGKSLVTNSMTSAKNEKELQKVQSELSKKRSQPLGRLIHVKEIRELENRESELIDKMK